MNKDIFQGKYKQIKGEIEKNWGKVSDDELKKVSGSATKFLGFLQEKFGLSKEEATKFVTKHIGNVDNLADKGKDAIGKLFD